MEISKLLKDHPEEFKKIGAIFYTLNYIEIELIVFLTRVFTNQFDTESEKSFIFNDALFDNGIFPAMENKRLLLQKIIEDINKRAIEKGKPFSYEKWRTFSRSLLTVQQRRNVLAHHHLGFIEDGKTVTYTMRKKARERIDDHNKGVKNATIKRIVIDLEEELSNLEMLSKDCNTQFNQLYQEIELIDNQ